MGSGQVILRVLCGSPHTSISDSRSATRGFVPRSLMYRFVADHVVKYPSS